MNSKNTMGTNNTNFNTTNYNSNFSPKKFSWFTILNAVIQAIVAALTALGVNSGINLM